MRQHMVLPKSGITEGGFIGAAGTEKRHWAGSR